MAAHTLLPERSDMNGRFRMAADTLVGCTFNNRLIMASYTIYRGVCAFQGKDSLVLKTDHGVLTIMAGLAILSILAAMVSGEDRLCRLMALYASDSRRQVLVLGMAVNAEDRCLVIVHSMLAQAELC